MPAKYKFTKYDPETGQIIGTMTCNLRSAQESKYVVEGHWDSLKYVVIDGVVQERHVEEAEQLRIEREQKGMSVKIKRLLRDSDWSQLPDVPLTGQERAAWAQYRAELRQLMSTSEDPRNVTWPTKPSG